MSAVNDQSTIIGCGTEYFPLWQTDRRIDLDPDPAVRRLVNVVQHALVAGPPDDVQSVVVLDHHVVLPVLEGRTLLDQRPGHSVVRTPHVVQQARPLATHQQYLSFEGRGGETGPFLKWSILSGSLPLQSIVRLPDFIVVVASFVLASHDVDIALVHEACVLESRGKCR